MSPELTAVRISFGWQFVKPRPAQFGAHSGPLNLADVWKLVAAGAFGEKGSRDSRCFLLFPRDRHCGVTSLWVIRQVVSRGICPAQKPTRNISFDLINGTLNL